MELLLVVGLALVMLWMIDRAGIALSNGAVRVLVRGFVVWLGGKLDPWPSGVQEEDRNQPWGSGTAVRNLPPVPTIPLLKVQAVVRH